MMQQFKTNTVVQALHSVYSFSASNRWVACPASIRLCKGVKNESNPAAELGTAAHELGEFCIKWGVNPDDCVGMTFNKHVVDGVMSEFIKLYTGFSDDLTTRTGVKPLLEKKVTMTSLGRNDAYGTGDHFLIDLNNRTLYVSDLKYGYGIVEVSFNSQLIAYAIAMLDTYELWPKIDKVVTTIIQPRKQHIDGPIRQHTYTTAELVEKQKLYAQAIVLAEDPNTKAVAGDHCLYCPRKDCRTRLDYEMNVMFPDSPLETISNGEVGIIYNRIAGVKRFLDNIEQMALDNAQKGQDTPEGHKLVRAIQWSIMEDEKAMIADCEKAGVDTDQLYDKKLKSKTKVKKLIPTEIVNKHWKAPPSKTTLAKLNDNRPAVNINSAAGMFKPVSTVTAAGMFQPIK